MKVLVTGASGLLGEDVVDFFSSDHEVVALKGRKVLDITNAEQTIDFIRLQNPDVIIHCAGWRNVDDVEKEKEKALLINVLGTKNIVLGARKVGCKFVHISSDSVFDGKKGAPYNEFDMTCPVNSYGYSKVQAEKMVTSLMDKYFIVRVPLLFGSKGYRENNILYYAWEKIKKSQKLYCPTDQVCSPTYTRDVAKVLENMIKTEFYGLYHVANEGLASRYELMKTAVEYKGLNTLNVIACTSDSKYAKRPQNTAFNCLAYNATFKLRISDWQSALKRCIDEMQ